MTDNNTSCIYLSLLKNLAGASPGSPSIDNMTIQCQYNLHGIVNVNTLVINCISTKYQYDNIKSFFLDQVKKLGSSQKVVGGC